MIGDYAIKNAHNGNAIVKVITLPNNRIASYSDTIKIWKSDPPYSDTPIKVLTGHSGRVNCLVYLTERNKLLSVSVDKTLRLWDISTYQCETIIENVEMSNVNSLYQIDNDRVIVGGMKTIFIVNIVRCVIEKTIKDKSFGYVRCFLKLRDNIFCGCYCGNLICYDMNTQQYTINKNKDTVNIISLLLINNDTFVSYSYMKAITVWGY